jgi:hypothetical protein
MKSFCRYSVPCALAAFLLSNTSFGDEPVRTATVNGVATAKIDGTHQQSSDIKLQSTDGKMRLQTMSVDAKGRVLGLVAPPKTFGAPVKDAASEVHVVNPDGKTVGVWTVKFHANSINAGPDGTVYVAGDGRVAKFSPDGKDLGVVELPHIKELLADKDGLRKQAEDQIKRQKELYANALKSMVDRKKAIEDKKEADRTDLEKRQLQQYEQTIKAYEQIIKQQDDQKLDTVIDQLTGRLRTINGIAVSEKDIFIACGDTKGFGYAMWRMTSELKEPKLVLSGIGGCCGQMDIQVSGDELLVAENTKHRFARYTRDGKEIGGYGKRGTGNDPECFGGCCNPMNVRAIKNGDVFTAESEGIIKRFSSKGEYLGNVAQVSLTGGCKNVAVGASPDGSKVYFCDQPGSRIIVLSKKSDK